LFLLLPDKRKPAVANRPPQVKSFRLTKAKFKTPASRQEKPLARIETEILFKSFAKRFKKIAVDSRK
jgi:hypothetical protein